MVDPGQITQALMNLCVNARDAMPEGGVITLTTRNITVTKDDAAHHHDARPGSFVCLSVKDTGVGMTPEIMARIFEPFYTTKPTGRGTGLGLSVVYGVLKQNGGWVTVESAPDHGSTFSAYLPITGAGGDRKESDDSAVALAAHCKSGISFPGQTLQHGRSPARRGRGIDQIRRHHGLIARTPGATVFPRMRRGFVCLRRPVCPALPRTGGNGYLRRN
jgi:hypothetical protein